ncbi:MAG: protein kinase [Chloroflexi bacterium]|uniref:protein kinase domain-containing protein n=1 Tax=Candidatus Flexifilum breve TaxID=3140694 RepID=UPI003135450C|nr:protein kinase [Chloroflexota bacterium]
MAANQYAGKEIGDYILEERIGRGATADVYRARQKSVQRDVALKVINPVYNIDDQQDFRQRFEHEAKIIAALEHIHILPVHDYGVTEDGLAYIVMRLMRGGSLDDLITSSGLPLSRAALLFTQVASALHYAHERGIVHRDVKPSNILLDDTGNAYVSDFGVAKFMDHPSLSLTKTGYIIGAPAYCSPEQLRDLPVDRRSDVYSLGILLYTMLIGHTPFARIAAGVLDMIDKQINVPPPPPRLLRPDIPVGVEQVILNALNKSPEERFPTAQALSDALTAALQGEPTGDSVPKEARAPRQPTSDRSLLRLYGFGVIGVVVAIVLLFAFSQLVGLSEISQPPNPTILVGERGTAAEVAPADEELRRAQRRVGTAQFIAFVTCTLESQTQATRAREMAERAASYGLRFEVYDPAMNPTEQAMLIEQALEAGARALIICPLDDAALRESIQHAHRAHVPVVFTFPIASDNNAVMVEPDNDVIGQLVGREAGNYIRDHFDRPANVVVLGASQLETSNRRMAAMQAGLLETAPEAQIVGEYAANADRDSGYAAMRDILQAEIDFDVVLSLSDATSFGAIRALEEAGIAPDEIAIFSVNGESLAEQYVREGYYLRATLQISAAEVAQISVDALVRLLGDATVPQYIVLAQNVLITRDGLEASPQD